MPSQKKTEKQEHVRYGKKKVHDNRAPGFFLRLIMVCWLSFSHFPCFLAALCLVLAGVCQGVAMIRSIRLRHAGVSSRALQAQPCKVAFVSCSTVPPLPPSISADKPADKAPPPPPPSGSSRVVAARHSGWRPSEAHKTSATSVARKEVCMYVPLEGILSSTWKRIGTPRVTGCCCYVHMVNMVKQFCSRRETECGLVRGYCCFSEANEWAIA